MAHLKPVVDIRGLLMDPIKIGCSAVICQQHGTRITSAVLHSFWISQDVLGFETRNTFYRLHLEKGRDCT